MAEEERKGVMASAPITSGLALVSSRFANELLELTDAIERGEDIAHRIKVLREYANTWSAIAERLYRTAGADAPR